MYALYFHDKLSCLSRSKAKLKKLAEEVLEKYEVYSKNYDSWLQNYCDGDEPPKPDYPVPFDDAWLFLRPKSYAIVEVTTV
jgi:hypothetical protein